MFFFDSFTHDPVSGILTVRSVTPSREYWTLEEYRDVPASLAAELAVAAPHGGEFLRERIVPFHAVRRVAEGQWHTPEPPDPEWLAAVGSSGAVQLPEEELPFP